MNYRVKNTTNWYHNLSGLVREPVDFCEADAKVLLAYTQLRYPHDGFHLEPAEPLYHVCWMHSGACHYYSKVYGFDVGVSNVGLYAATPLPKAEAEKALGHCMNAGSNRYAFQLVKVGEKPISKVRIELTEEQHAKVKEWLKL